MPDRRHVVMTTDNPLETLDRHWAVKVVTPEDRAAAIQFGMGVLTRLCSGDAPAETESAPEFVVPLAGAYVIAAAEWLDFDGAAAPSAILSTEQGAQRTAHIEAGADRAFILTAALPIEANERVAALYRALLLAGLAQLAHKQTEFRHWLRANERMLFPPSESAARRAAISSCVSSSPSSTQSSNSRQSVVMSAPPRRTVLRCRTSVPAGRETAELATSRL